jgi:hypothetical protein
MCAVAIDAQVLRGVRSGRDSGQVKAREAARIVRRGEQRIHAARSRIVQHGRHLCRPHRQTPPHLQIPPHADESCATDAALHCAELTRLRPPAFAA